MEKELKESILDIVAELKKNGTKEIVVRWAYPEEPDYMIELVVGVAP